jgi:predicted SAM-dependent methyltransferase
MSEQKKIDIGCGKIKKDGFIGVDLEKFEKVDVVADVRFLPFKSESFDYVYSSHVIEHISHLETQETLNEWIRILKTNCPIEIRCPDFRASCLRFVFRPDWKYNRGMFGMQTSTGQFHKCGFSYGILRGILRSKGIKEIKRVRDWNKIFPWADLHVIGKK